MRAFDESHLSESVLLCSLGASHGQQCSRNEEKCRTIFEGILNPLLVSIKMDINPDWKIEIQASSVKILWNSDKLGYMVVYVPARWLSG